MFYSELKRILYNKRLLVILLVLLASMVFYLSFLFLNTDNQNYQAQLNNGEITHQYLLNQRQVYENYHDDIEETIANNEKKLELSIFDDSRLHQQIIKENKLLDQLKNIDVKLINTYAVSNLLHSSFYGIVLIFFTLIISHAIFVEDVNYSLINLYASTKTSNNRHLRDKLLLFSVLTIVFMISYFITFVALARMNGVNLNNPIQLISEYRFYYQLSSISEVFFLHLLRVTLSVLTITLLVLSLFLLFQNMSLSYGLVLIFLVVQYLMNGFISLASPWSFLKYYNLYYLSFDGLSTINRPFILFGVITVVLILILFMLFYQRLHMQSKRHLNNGFKLKTISLKIHEFFRVFIFSKGFILIVILLAYGFNRYASYTVSKSETQQLYEQFESQYYGEITQSKIDQLVSDVNESEVAYKIIMSCHDDETCDDYTEEELKELDEKAQNYSLLNSVYQQVDGLWKQGETYFVQTEGYKYIFGQESFLSTIINFLLVSSSVTLFVSMNTVSEIQSKQFVLLSSTTNIKNKKHWDTINYVIFTLLSMIIVYGLFVLKIKKGYVVFNSDIPLSVTQLSNNSMSLYSYSMLSFVIHCFIYMTLIRVVKRLSQHFDVVVVLLIIMLVCLVNIIIFLIKPSLSLLWLLTINVISNPLVSVCWIIILIIINLTFNSNFIYARIG